MFNDSMYAKSTLYISFHTMSASLTGQITKQPECRLVKYLSQFICISHFSMTKCTLNNLSKLADK